MNDECTDEGTCSCRDTLSQNSTQNIPLWRMIMSYQHEYLDYYRGICFGQGKISTDIISLLGLVSFILSSCVYSPEFVLGESQNGVLGLSPRYKSLTTSSAIQRINQKSTETMVRCLGKLKWQRSTYKYEKLEGKKC